MYTIYILLHLRIITRVHIGFTQDFFDNLYSKRVAEKQSNKISKLVKFS